MIAEIIGYLGYTLDAAWSLTPREMRTLRKAIHTRRLDSAYWTLWGAHAARRKNLPTLAEMLGDTESPSLPTRAEFDRQRAADKAYFQRIYGDRFRWPGDVKEQAHHGH